MLTRKLIFYTITFAFLWASTIGETQACHIFGATDLMFTENPSGSGLYDVSFEYFASARQNNSCFLYTEVHIVEAGCPASTCTEYSAATSCIDARIGNDFPGDGSQTVTPITGLPLCPGKGYEVVFLFRRAEQGCDVFNERNNPELGGP